MGFPARQQVRTVNCWHLGTALVHARTQDIKIERVHVVASHANFNTILGVCMYILFYGSPIIISSIEFLESLWYPCLRFIFHCLFHVILHYRKPYIPKYYSSISQGDTIALCQLDRVQRCGMLRGHYLACNDIRIELLHLQLVLIWVI